MPLPSFLRRATTPAPKPDQPPAGAPAAVAAARARARRRLIGAVLLLGVGVIGFPLLFETEPRPIPVDLPIEIPKKDGAPPLAMPAARSEKPPSAAPTPASSAMPAPTASAVAPSRPPASAPEALPAPQPAKPAAAPVKADPAPAPKADDGQRAKALLEGKAQPAAPSASRYVVQIGAFASDKTVAEVRAKARAAGLETFTQTVKVSNGEATRVRVGPFGAREEADAAAAKVRKAGLPATVLKL